MRERERERSDLVIFLHLGPLYFICWCDKVTFYVKWLGFKVNSFYNLKSLQLQTKKVKIYKEISHCKSEIYSLVSKVTTKHRLLKENK